MLNDALSDPSYCRDESDGPKTIVAGLLRRSYRFVRNGRVIGSNFRNRPEAAMRKST